MAGAGLAGWGQARRGVLLREIPAMRDLVMACVGLGGAVITMDAMRTSAGTAKVILAQHADFLMIVKASMPALYW